MGEAAALVDAAPAGRDAPELDMDEWMVPDDDDDGAGAGAGGRERHRSKPTAIPSARKRAHADGRRQPRKRPAKSSRSSTSAGFGSYDISLFFDTEDATAGAVRETAAQKHPDKAHGLEDDSHHDEADDLPAPSTAETASTPFSSAMSRPPPSSAPPPVPPLTLTVLVSGTFDSLALTSTVLGDDLEWLKTEVGWSVVCSNPQTLHPI